MTNLSLCFFTKSSKREFLLFETPPPFALPFAPLPWEVFFLEALGERHLSRPLPPEEYLSARSLTVEVSLSSLLASALTSEDWLLEETGAERLAELEELEEESGAEMAR